MGEGSIVMRCTPLTLATGAILVAGAAALGTPAKSPTYVLDGYRFEGLLGPGNTGGLVAKLKNQPGSRIKKADIKADIGILAKELHARHIRGQLFTGLIEGGGHIWVIFHLANLDPPGAKLWTSRRLGSQQFENVSGIPAGDLVGATGLKAGDALSPEKIIAARKGLMALFAKLRPGKVIRIQARIQTKPSNEAALSWIIENRPQAR
jgi:hypothetical protein